LPSFAPERRSGGVGTLRPPVVAVHETLSSSLHSAIPTLNLHRTRPPDQQREERRRWRLQTSPSPAATNDSRWPYLSSPSWCNCFFFPFSSVSLQKTLARVSSEPQQNICLLQSFCDWSWWWWILIRIPKGNIQFLIISIMSFGWMYECMIFVCWVFLQYTFVERNHSLDYIWQVLQPHWLEKSARFDSPCSTILHYVSSFDKPRNASSLWFKQKYKWKNSKGIAFV
jgi:hypothetical protein